MDRLQPDQESETGAKRPWVGPYQGSIRESPMITCFRPPTPKTHRTGGSAGIPRLPGHTAALVKCPGALGVPAQSTESWMKEWVQVASNPHPDNRLGQRSSGAIPRMECLPGFTSFFLRGWSNQLECARKFM